MSYKLIIFGMAALLLALLSADVQKSYAADSASVKIRVDIENVSVSVNDSAVSLDSYGSSLSANTWFILNLSPGQYSFAFYHADYDSVKREINIAAGEIEDIEIYYLSQPSDTLTDEVGIGVIQVTSVPDSVFIVVNGNQIEEQTPASLQLPYGIYNIEVNKEGLEPLSDSVRLNSSSNIIMEYLMRPLPPAPVSAESPGMAKEAMIQKTDERTADALKQKYYNLAEMFAIIPLGQGIFGKLLMEGDYEKTTNTMILSGAILSGGSLILGKILSSRKRKQIIIENQRIVELNEYNKAQNRAIDDKVAEYNDQKLEEWLLKSDSLGIVNITLEDR